MDKVSGGGGSTAHLDKTGNYVMFYNYSKY